MTMNDGNCLSVCRGKEAEDGARAFELFRFLNLIRAVHDDWRCWKLTITSNVILYEHIISQYYHIILRGID